MRTLYYLVRACIVALLLTSATVQAQSSACTIGDTTEIYFINGQSQSLAQARSARNVLEDAYENSLNVQYPGPAIQFYIGLQLQ